MHETQAFPYPLGSAITANVNFFFFALFTAILIFLIFGQFTTIHHLKEVPSILYITGVISAFVVLGSTILIPHIGARKFFILLIAGQVLMAIVVSHFGLLESPKNPINMKKMIGAILVLTGAIFSTY